MSVLAVPHIQPGEHVILFDGVCKLCHAWARFIIRYDTARCFRLCSVQSVEGEAILQHFGLATHDYETMLYVHNQQCYQRSEAFFEVMTVLGYPWKLVGLFRYLPLHCRDYLYNGIARRRYRWFGKYEQCLLPTADHQARFIDER